jgi:hypothetical protein
MSSTTSESTIPTDSPVSAGGCCGGPAPEGAGACCARDAEVKATGGTGCGCGAETATTPKPARRRSACCG